MENLDKYTPIELQKMSNDIVMKHEALKDDIIKHTYKLEEIENLINEKSKELEELEKNYVRIIEKLVE